MSENDRPQGTPPPTPPPQPSAPPPPPPGPQPGPAGGQPSSNRNLMIVLSYFGILCLIPLFVEKEDREVQWHAKHGLVLMVAEIILFIALGILGTLLGFITGGLGCLFSLLYPLVALAIIVLHVMEMVKGINGQRLLIPGVSEFADKF